MKDIFINLMTAAVIPPLSSWTSYVVILRRKSVSGFYCGWMCSAIYGAIALAREHEPWYWSLIAAVNAGIAAYLWWRRTKRRKRAPRAYGAKSKALVAALVRKSREAAQPRRVLRPLPNPG